MADASPGIPDSKDKDIKPRIKPGSAILMVGLCVYFFPALIVDVLTRVICIAGILAGLVIATFFLQRNEAGKKHVPFLIVISLGCCISLPQAFWGSGSTVEIKVLNVLFGMAFCVVSILLAIKILHLDPKTMFLKKGNLKIGLGIGFITFGLFFVSAIPAATYLFGGKNVSWEMMFSLLPWIIVFILMNAVREELWFRAIYLDQYRAYLGQNGANWMQAIIFTLAHSSMSLFKNPTFTAIYFGIILVLGLGFGAIMLKGDSVLGSLLFHAGSDIPVILAAFSAVL
jgi:uncharacterized protein